MNEFRILIVTIFVHLADAAASLPASVQKLKVSTAAHQKQQEILKQVSEQQFVPKEPPPEFEFIADPPSISALDLWVSHYVGHIHSSLQQKKKKQ